MGSSLFTEKLGAGPPLILLPGWGMHSSVFQSIARRLAKTHQVISVDLPGFGQSAMLKKPYKLGNIAEVILQYAPKRAAWLGWSLGGLIVLFIARYFPERVSQAFLIASSPKFIEDEQWPGISNKTFEAFFKNLKQDPNETLLHFLGLQCHGTKEFKETSLFLKNKIVHSNQPHPRALIGGLSLLFETDFREELSKIDCALVFVLGGKDILVPVGISQYLLSFGKNITCAIMEEAGHVPFLSHEEYFLSCIYNNLV